MGKVPVISPTHALTSDDSGCIDLFVYMACSSTREVRRRSSEVLQVIRLRRMTPKVVISWQSKKATICPSLTRSSPGAYRFSARSMGVDSPKGKM